MLAGVKRDISKIENRIYGSGTSYGPVATFFTVFQGRATTFAILFSIEGAAIIAVGLYGFLQGKDLSSLASLMTASATLNTSIQAMVFAHSVKEDWASLKQQEHDLKVALSQQTPAVSSAPAATQQTGDPQ